VLLFKKFETTAAFIAIVLTTQSLFKRIHLNRLQKLLLNDINKSKFVDKIVLLGLDEVYDEEGTCHPELSHLVTPNRYLAKLSNQKPHVLFGCSIHSPSSFPSIQIFYAKTKTKTDSYRMHTRCCFTFWLFIFANRINTRNKKPQLIVEAFKSSKQRPTLSRAVP
jgi:hypothetical protein